MNLISKIIDYIGKDLGSILVRVIGAAKIVFGYLEHRLTYKEVKEAKKEAEKAAKEEKKLIEKEQKSIKDICDKGSLDDLLNKFLKTSVIVLASLSIAGCATGVDLEVTTTRQWEGHYFTEKDFYKATRELDLQKNESIWVLSNATLNKILTSQRNDK